MERRRDGREERRRHDETGRWTEGHLVTYIGLPVVVATLIPSPMTSTIFLAVFRFSFCASRAFLICVSASENQ